MCKPLFLTPACLALCACLASPSFAALNLTVIDQPSFGKIHSGASGREFKIDSGNTMSGANAADSVLGVVTGQLTVSDTTPGATIRITVSNVVTSGGFGNPIIFCDYDGGGMVQCDGAGTTVTSVSNATLYVSVQVDTTQAHVGADTSHVDFDISVSYE